jgi:hypothetical protein
VAADFSTTNALGISVEPKGGSPAPYWRHRLAKRTVKPHSHTLKGIAHSGKGAGDVFWLTILLMNKISQPPFAKEAFLGSLRQKKASIPTSFD